MHLLAFNRHDIEAARSLQTMAPEEVLRRAHQALPFVGTNGSRRATVAAVAARTHFNKHHGALPILQDQVDLASPLRRPAGHSIVALQQLQALTKEVLQGKVLGLLPLHRL